MNENRFQCLPFAVFFIQPSQQKHIIFVSLTPIFISCLAFRDVMYMEALFSSSRRVPRRVHRKRKNMENDIKSPLRHPRRSFGLRKKRII